MNTERPIRDESPVPDTAQDPEDDVFRSPLIQYPPVPPAHPDILQPKTTLVGGEQPLPNAATPLTTRHFPGITQRQPNVRTKRTPRKIPSRSALRPPANNPDTSVEFTDLLANIEPETRRDIILLLREKDYTVYGLSRRTHADMEKIYEHIYAMQLQGMIEVVRHEYRLNAKGRSARIPRYRMMIPDVPTPEDA